MIKVTRKNSDEAANFRECCGKITKMNSKHNDPYLVTRRVTLVGSVVDGVLGALKLGVGMVGQSQALVADGVHSLSDLVTDILVIWAAKQSHSGPDQNHPYGHERIETLATIVLAVALLAVAVGFFYDAAGRLISPDRLQQPGSWVLIAAMISVVAKEAIYHYTLRAARLINSNLLRANAWHSRSDAASSVIVLVGVLGVMSGFEYADALASMGVSVMIGWVGWKFGREGVDELIDTSVDADLLKDIQQAMVQVEGVMDVHQIRTRKMAGKIIMDAHITVKSMISVSEGHRIGDAVEQVLHQRFSDLSDTTIHVDYEDDAQQRLAYELPLRGAVLQDMALAFLEHQVGVTVEDFLEVKLHYLNGSIELELWRQSDTADCSEFAEQEAVIKKALMGVPHIGAVVCLYQFI